MYVRYLADTSHPARSPMGRYALDYLKAVLEMRPVIPVRIGTVTGSLEGSWDACAGLLMTPMEGRLINVVCCYPERWTWVQRVPFRRGSVVDEDDDADAARVELWTAAAARNVLIAPLMPLAEDKARASAADAEAQLASARKYDVIITPDSLEAERWRAAGKEPVVFSTPVRDVAAFRAAILG